MLTSMLQCISESQDVSGSLAKIRSFHLGSPWMAVKIPSPITGRLYMYR